MSIRHDELSVLYAAVERLRQEGIPIPDTAEERLRLHAELVRRSTRICGLVSSGDELALYSRHTCDSLGLIPVYYMVCPELKDWVDVGSGGGFPALPVAIMLPEVRFILYERSRRKSTFLNRAICETGLERQVQTYERSFPEGFTPKKPMIFTARAVEAPGRIQNILARVMPPGSVYLCQGKLLPAFENPMFHVEHVSGDWPWRRGVLILVRRIQ